MVDESPLPRSHFLHDKSIAVVGAGPAGLTLARLLQMRGCRVRVFERDTSPRARDQGGSLDLHEDSGQLALIKAGLSDQLRSVFRPEGQATTVFDKHGQVAVELRAEDEAESRPEIDRLALRDLLLGSLAPDTVIWDRQLVRIEAIDAAPPGKYRLVFKQEEVRADLVIGCDGAWSKVRALVSDTPPHYGGVTFVETRITAADTRFAHLAELVGPGNIMALGENKALMAQRNGDGHIRVYVALRVPEDWTRGCGFALDQPEQARAGLLDLFSGWAPALLALLHASDDVFLNRPLFTFPPQQTWRANPGITLAGDAAHVMPPFTGKGANYAMLDAVELAENLTSDTYADLPSALRAYESVMLERMSHAIVETLGSQALVIAPDAPAGLVSMIEEQSSGASPK